MKVRSDGRITITVRVEPEKARAFKARCAERGDKMNDVLSKAVDEYMASGEGLAGLAKREAER